MSNLLPTAAYLAPVLAFIASKPSNLMGLPLAMMMVIFACVVYMIVPVAVLYSSGSLSVLHMAALAVAQAAVLYSTFMALPDKEDEAYKMVNGIPYAALGAYVTMLAMQP